MTILREALELARDYVADAVADQESGLAEGIYEDRDALKSRRADLAKIDAALAIKPGRIGVCLEGGMVQSIFTDDPALVGLEAIVIDYDTDGADETMLIPQDHGEVEEACCNSWTVASAGVGLAEIGAALDSPKTLALSPQDDNRRGIEALHKLGGDYCIVHRED